jgi:hypothetical protein
MNLIPFQFGSFQARRADNGTSLGIHDFGQLEALLNRVTE